MTLGEALAEAIPGFLAVTTVFRIFYLGSGFLICFWAYWYINNRDLSFAK